MVRRRPGPGPEKAPSTRNLKATRGDQGENGSSVAFALLGAGLFWKVFPFPKPSMGLVIFTYMNG